MCSTGVTGLIRTHFLKHSPKWDICQWHYGVIAEHFLFQTGRTLNWFQANFLNTTAFAEHDTLYRWGLGMEGYQSLFEHAKRRRIQTLRETIVDYKHEKLDPELEFQIVALADAEVGGVTHWFVGNMPYSIETLCRYLDDAVPRRLYNMLNEPADDTISRLFSL